MALHPNFPDDPHAILEPQVRWFPADESLRESSMEKLMPPLVSQLRRKVQEWRDSGYVGATGTSKSLLQWWFQTPHLLEQSDGTMEVFQYFFAQREALETIVYLVDVVGVQDKFDLMRFDSSGAVSASMFDETWRRLAMMNLAIRGIEGDLGPEHADTFRRDLHKDLKADYVLANPPFNGSDWHRSDEDVRWKYGLPPKGNANFAWVQHFIHQLRA